MTNSTNHSTTAKRRSPLREIAAYLSLTYALALGIAVGLPDANINKLFSLFVPMLSVTILTFTYFKKGSRRALWGGLGLGRAGLRSWLPALLLPVVLCGAAYGAALLIGAGRLADLNIDADEVGGWTLGLLVGLVVWSVVIIGEEIGWRGFMLPRVQELTDKRRAALITGFAHGCFHLPLILIASTYDAEGVRWIVAPAAVATITAGGVFFAWLRDRSGSVWPVAIGHNAVNTVFDLGATVVIATSPASLAYVAGETGFATMGACVALAIVLLARAKVWQRPATTAPQPTRPQALAVG